MWFANHRCFINRWLSLAPGVAGIILAGCGPAADSSASRASGDQSNNQSKNARSPVTAPAVDPCALVLASHRGNTSVDKEIIRLQQAIPGARDPLPLLERLGWMFVSKARASFDPGYYKLAEQCAFCLEAKQPGAVEALLLRGHVLQNLHRFREAEPLARQLAARRGLPFDFGLLGDVLMEQGNLTEAIDAYQKMADLKPDPQAYARVAHVRWLKGDLEGALEMMRAAAQGATPQNPESAAWFHARLAAYELQAGHGAEARQACAAASEFQKDYPPALLLLGRMALAEGKGPEAIEPLRRAALANPLPDYQWTLAEAFRAVGSADEAKKTEDELRQTGAADDPRTFSLFLSTRHEQPALAIELAERELKERADVHTHDALAWALASAGRWDEARRHSEQALAEGTADARIYLHAGLIAAGSVRRDDASRWLGLAENLQQMLLPTERDQLKIARERILSSRTGLPPVPSLPRSLAQ
jgi:tetratricopeptide (TPR) repeat protein